MGGIYRNRLSCDRVRPSCGCPAARKNQCVNPAAVNHSQFQLAILRCCRDRLPHLSASTRELSCTIEVDQDQPLKMQREVAFTIPPPRGTLRGYRQRIADRIERRIGANWKHRARPAIRASTLRALHSIDRVTPSNLAIALPFRLLGQRCPVEVAAGAPRLNERVMLVQSSSRACLSSCRRG